MASYILSRVLLAGGIAFLLARDAWERAHPEAGGMRGPTSRRRPKYAPWSLSGLLLPLLLLSTVAFGLLLTTPGRTFQSALSQLFSISLVTCVYYPILAALLPLLRQKISPRTCALLWLLPNLLICTHWLAGRLPEPRWVIEIDSLWLAALFALWLLGFAGLFGWSILDHLRFRSRILNGAEAIGHPSMLDLWRENCQMAGSKRTYPLFYADGIHSPLSIGLFHRTICVLLPRRLYTKEELDLIFQHELCHIQRGDSAIKLLMAFCRALCWWNPLMWMAMGRTAEDLELSCDDSVLEGHTGRSRRQYADLILRTAGESRGFTTCLSASAQAVRYRLKQIVDPRLKQSGAGGIALAVLLLLLSGDWVALAYDPQEGLYIFEGQPAGYTVDYMMAETHGQLDRFACSDPAGLLRYLQELPLARMSVNYQADDYDFDLGVWLTDPDGETGRVTIRQGRFVTVKSDAQPHLRPLVYYSTRPVDTDYLRRLLEEIPEPPVTTPPQLFVSWGDDQSTTVFPIDGRVADKRNYRTGLGLPFDEYPIPDGPVTIERPDDGQLGLRFSTGPLDGAYSVEIRDQDMQIVATLDREMLDGPLPLPETGTHYTVRATIFIDVHQYNMVYEFKVA